MTLVRTSWLNCKLGSSTNRGTRRESRSRVGPRRRAARKISTMAAVDSSSRVFYFEKIKNQRKNKSALIELAKP
jgi:hypothetical protein